MEEALEILKHDHSLKFEIMSEGSRWLTWRAGGGGSNRFLKNLLLYIF
jgi:hypothetical protein